MLFAKVNILEVFTRVAFAYAFTFFECLFSVFTEAGNYIFSILEKSSDTQA